MAKRKAKEPSPFELVRQAVEAGGYRHTIEEQGNNTVLTVEVGPNTHTVAVFGPDGRPVPPPGVRELIEEALRRHRPAPIEEPPQEGLESINYDFDQYGRCSDEAPCQGLSALMASSCVEHGGVVGMADGPDAKVPDFVGFVPTPHHRRGQLLTFNFCPCCGRDLRSTDKVLGADGLVTLQ